MAPLLPLWGDCVHYYRSGKYSDLLVELDKLRQAAVEAGLPNATPLSSALVRMAIRLLDAPEPDAEVAFGLLRHAQRLSPGIPDYRFIRSRELWRHDKARVGEYAGEFFQGVRLAFRHFPSLLGGLLGGLGLLWAAGFLVMLLFSVMLLARYLPLFAHDVGHASAPVFLRGMSSFQLNLMVLVLLFIPFLADFGLVPLFALWWVAFWLYQSRGERVVTILMVVFVYAWPLLNGLFVNSLGFAGGTADRAYRCMVDVCPRDDLAALEGDLDKGASHGAVLFAAASAWYRGAGRDPDSMEKAFSLFRKGEKALAGTLRADFSVGLGNVFFLKGMQRCNRARGNLDAGIDDFQSANKYYDAALAVRPEDWRARYNKGKVLYTLGNTEEGQQLLARAGEIAPGSVADLEAHSLVSGERGCSEHFVATRELALPHAAIPMLWAEEFGDEALSRSMERLPVAHGLLLGWTRTWMLALLSTSVLLLVILLFVLQRHLRLSGRCIKCARISCMKCRPELSGTGLCNQCVYYRIRSSYVDPKESWMREKRIENRLRFRRRLENVLTFLLPGAGHLLRGRALRGAVFMLGVAMGVSGMFLFDHLVSLAYAAPEGLPVGTGVGLVPWAVLALVSYFLALLDIYSWR